MTRRRQAFLIFFSIVLSLYTLLNAYIFWHGWQLVPQEYRTVFAIVYVGIAYAFIVGRFLERVMLNWISTSVVFVGAYWLGAMVYFVFLFLAVDILRIASAVIPFIPSIDSVPGLTPVLTLGVTGAVPLIVIAGAVNARRIRIKRLEITIDRQMPNARSLTLAVASDIHLGTIINRRRVEKIVTALNSLDADIVFLPGDVVDEDLAPVIKENLGEMLRTIQSRYGVFAITGNHEYIGGAEAAVQYLRDHGITVLRDDVVVIDNTVTIVGRDDLTSNRFADRQRKPLAELMTQVNTSLPVILMDHQPFRLQEAEAHGIDLQLSGHTHHGQLWPFSYVTRRVYEVSWGYLKKGGTHYYVSSGVGTWGPPMKIGNHAEIVAITLRTR